MHRLVLFIKKIFMFSFCQGSGCWFFFLPHLGTRHCLCACQRCEYRACTSQSERQASRPRFLSASSLLSLWHETEPTEPNTRGAASRPAERWLKPPTLKGQGRLLWLYKSCSTVFRYQLNFVEFLFFWNCFMWNHSVCSSCSNRQRSFFWSFRGPMCFMSHISLAFS